MLRREAIIRPCWWRRHPDLAASMVAVGALVVVGVFAVRSPTCCGGSDKVKTQMARAVVAGYVTAYATWSKEHGCDRCPDSLAELDDYFPSGVSEHHQKDPWGTPYVLRCHEPPPGE